MFAKSDTLTKFINFQKFIATQFNSHIKILRSDGGGEYTSHAFQTHLSNHDIIHQQSYPYTPEQNGFAEHKHRHIVETARTLLLAANIPHSLWMEAVLTSVYLINRLPSKTTYNKSPYQLLYNKPPNYNHLKVFGCAAFPGKSLLLQINSLQQLHYMSSLATLKHSKATNVSTSPSENS